MASKKQKGEPLGEFCTSYIGATGAKSNNARAKEFTLDPHNYRHHSEFNKRMILRSLNECGAGRSILVDADNNIIAGNGVYEQAINAGKKIQIVETDGETLYAVKRTDLHLDDAKRKKLALADNAASDSSEWDATALQDDWSNEELANWGIEIPQEEDLPDDDDEWHDRKEHREATFAIDNFDMFCNIPRDEVTDLGFPIIRPVDYVPRDGVIPFSDMLAAKDAFKQGIHFFVDDYRFSRVWTSPERYDDHLAQHAFVIMPDFSTYTDMPFVLQAYNKFRNHLLAWHWQSLGMIVIPNVMFSTEESWEWIFDGMPHNSTVCISNVGVMQNKEWRDAFMDGMKEAIRVLTPKRIIFYGRTPKDYDFGEIETIEIQSTSFRSGNK